MNEIISVIMSTFNEKIDWVEKSIDSILNQTYKNLEFIIVLDNPDNYALKELLTKYEASDKRIKLIINNRNLGLVKSLNNALKHCNGKYIARMDADDISLPDRLSVQKKYLEENNYDFIFSSIQIIDENDNSLNITNEEEYTPAEFRDKLEKPNISAHPTWLVKKEVYQKLNGYREVLFCEDYDFTLRCPIQGYKIGKLN
jgi:GT2 family glycosyltransferase